MSFFKKLSTLAAGTSHDILDKIIDNNSPTMLRQYARELETQVEILTGEAATAAGSVRTTTRERDIIQSKIDADKAAGTKLKEGTLADKDARMQRLATEIVQLRQDLAIKQQALDAATAASSQLDLVTGKVKAKSGEINARIKYLESMDATSKAKAHAADVIGQTADLLGNGIGSVSIDNIAAKIQAKSDVADVKLERAVGSFNDANPNNSDPIAISDVMNEF